MQKFRMFLRRVIVRARLVFMLGPIAVDCIGCMVFGGSWRNTISGEAWNNRDQPRWNGVWEDIDAVFGKWHCQRQAAREAGGSVWQAWAADWQQA